MIRVLLTLLTLVAVGGAGAGAFSYIHYLKQQEFTTANSHPVFVDIDPIYVPIVANGELIETRVYTFSIETREGGPHEMVINQRPKLHDLYLRYCNALAGRRGPENLDNTDYLKSQLITASSEMLGPDVVYRVLLQSSQARTPDFAGG